MASRNAVVFSAVLLGIVAVGLSFAAYTNRIKAADVTVVNGNCTYPSRPATALGILAALVLLIEQILVSIGTGCFCCGGRRCPSSCAGITSIILFILSWVSFIITFAGLIATARLNDGSYLTDAYPGNGTSIGGDKILCYRGNENLFLGAAIWCVISIVLGVISSLLLFRPNSDHENNQAAPQFAYEHGVAMGQPAYK